MRFERLLALAAALLTAQPSPARGRTIWIDLCDAAHPGRRIPLPIDSDRDPPAACHAACALLPERRARR